MSEKRILITGATGKTGSAVCARLEELGIEALAASRSGKSVGNAQGVVFDWMDPKTHGDVLQGVSGIYLIAPALVLDPVAPMSAFIDLAVAKGVQNFALLGSSAIPENGPAMGQIHSVLKEKTKSWVVLQPSWFMQNFTEGHHGDSIRDEGAIYSATGDARIAFIDARDIGRTAAGYLAGDDMPNDGVVLTGPTPVCYDDVAKIISDVLGKDVQHVKLSESALADRFHLIGMPEDYAGFLAGLDAFLAQGSEDRTTEGVAKICAAQPRAFEAFFKANQPS